MDGTLGKSFLKDYINKTHEYLSQTVLNEVVLAKELGEVPELSVKYFHDMVLEGKGIRGALVVLGYMLGGGVDLDRIYKASTFIEVFHSGILVQDDFMDCDDMRRGLPTIHKVFEKIGADLKVKTNPAHYGNSIAAVSVGDIAIYLSWRMLLESGFSNDLIIKCGKLYSKYVIRLVHGQTLDITYTGLDNASEEAILNVLWTKSGEYTSLLPLMVGYTLAGGNNQQVLEAIYAYAKCFGWAFQIQDDYLGLYGNEKELGKPIGSDIREGKNTLFVLQLRKNGTPEQLEFLKKVLGNKTVTAEDVEKMRGILKDCGAIEAVLKRGWDYVAEGKNYIPQLTKDTKTQEILESLISYMMERTK